MALTRKYRETVLERIKRDPEFTAALYAEAISSLVEGDKETALSTLRDLVHAHISFTYICTGTLMAQIVPHLWEGTFFIPSAVGLPDLAKRFEQQDYEFPTEDDHPSHELTECTPSDDAPTFDHPSGHASRVVNVAGMSADELLRRIVRCHEDGSDRSA